jgi:enamine deaminase RidA (YjgF/YER057c/UK114 family)
VLAEDERGRGFPAVVRYGPYLFISGSEGHRDLASERIVPELAGNATEQCRNSYGRIRRRLRQAGYSGDECVWIQNFTSGQEWRLQRMALWPEYFGETAHGLAVSFGAQARMPGINMITTVAMALTPDVERVAIVPQPEPGRAARVVKAGPFVYVIGVRGTGPGVPEETPEAFGAQLGGCWSALERHVRAAGSLLEDFVRVDACLRDPGRIGDYRAQSPALACAGYAVGVPLGARGEQEIGGVAVASGEPKEVLDASGAAGSVSLRLDVSVTVSGVTTAEHREVSGSGSVRQQVGSSLVKAGGLLFVPACRAAEAGGSADAAGQTRQALSQLESRLRLAGVGLDSVLRLDVFLRNVYFEDECLRLLRERFGTSMPALSFIGADLERRAEIELVAIAGP